MLSDHELLQYLANHRLAEIARRCILDTRNSNPFRAVRSGDKQNVCTAFASRKMGRSINTESGTAELAFAIEFEYSSEVREFWDQPQPVTIAKTASDGRIRKQCYTPPPASTCGWGTPALSSRGTGIPGCAPSRGGARP